MFLEETLKKIKPEAIESTNVLKGVQGSALYGEQGANGVIIIKTLANLSEKEQKKLDKLLKNDKKAQQTVVPISRPNQEEYESFAENPFTNPLTEALSTVFDRCGQCILYQHPTLHQQWTEST